MAGKVIKKVGVDYLPSSYEYAEQICGHKLDRRKNYAIINRAVCQSVCRCEAYLRCSCCDQNHSSFEYFGQEGKKRFNLWHPLYSEQIRTEKEMLRKVMDENLHS